MFFDSRISHNLCLENQTFRFISSAYSRVIAVNWTVPWIPYVMYFLLKLKHFQPTWMCPFVLSRANLHLSIDFVINCATPKPALCCRRMCAYTYNVTLHCGKKWARFFVFAGRTCCFFFDGALCISIPAVPTQQCNSNTWVGGIFSHSGSVSLNTAL